MPAPSIHLVGMSNSPLTPSALGNAPRIVVCSDYSCFITWLATLSTVTLFRTLGWLPIGVRIHYFTAVAMFNIMIGQAPVDLVHMFTQTNSVHDHDTRGGTNIRVKKYNLSIGQRTFAYRGAKVWDNIPEHIKNVTTVECFKTMC